MELFALPEGDAWLCPHCQGVWFQDALFTSEAPVDLGCLPLEAAYRERGARLHAMRCAGRGDESPDEEATFVDPPEVPGMAGMERFFVKERTLFHAPLLGAIWMDGMTRAYLVASQTSGEPFFLTAQLCPSLDTAVAQSGLWDTIGEWLGSALESLAAGMPPDA